MNAMSVCMYGRVGYKVNSWTLWLDDACVCSVRECVCICLLVHGESHKLNSDSTGRVPDRLVNWIR